MILVEKIVQILEEVQEHTLSFIKVGQLTMSHMFQDQFQPSAESEYNATCTEEMAFEHFRMLINEFLNKDPDIVPE